ncbi:MAG: hypothetical protein ACRC5C_13200 [Bacilli bacterium]
MKHTTAICKIEYTVQIADISTPKFVNGESYQPNKYYTVNHDTFLALLYLDCISENSDIEIEIYEAEVL